MVHSTGHLPAWLRLYPDSTLRAPQVSKHRQTPKPHTSGVPSAPTLQCALLHASLSKPQPRGN